MTLSFVVGDDLGLSVVVAVVGAALRVGAAVGLNVGASTEMSPIEMALTLAALTPESKCAIAEDSEA